ncbi:MAG: ABC transporter permease [Candidatus Omnitrophica bacterium]|nr:ABC transporter permease [Candidatus Omnitrophota bacterium]
MLNYLSKKAAELLITFFGITLVSFFLINLAPGKPTDVVSDLNPRMTPEIRAIYEKQWGLDKPLHIRYFIWLKNFSKFDFGNSFSSDSRPVWDKIRERLPITILINAISMFLIFLIAVPIGIHSAVKPNSLSDKVTTFGVFVGFAMPVFWLALILQLIFGVWLNVLPVSGIKSLNYENLSFIHKFFDSTRHLFLPIFITVFGSLAGLSRYMRSQMQEALSQEYIVTARAKGLPEKVVIYKHALRNAILPIITILGLSVPGLISGSVIFETIFAIPGVGQLLYSAAMARDINVIMAEVVIVSILTLIGNLLADIGYALADPRIRVK